MAKKPTIKIECSIEDLCYGRYCSDHAFTPDNLIARLEFAPYVDKDMSNHDIENAIIKNIKMSPWPKELDSIDFKEYQIRDAIKKEQQGNRDAKPFINMDLGPEIQLFGYIRFYA